MYTKESGRIKKFLVSGVATLALMLGLVSATPAAAAPSAAQQQSAQVASAVETISSVDRKLAERGRSVDSALDEFASFYRNELRTNNELTAAQRKGIEQNLKGLAEASADYVATRGPVGDYAASKSRVSPTGGDPFPEPTIPTKAICAAAVAAVIAYFWANGYVFAADLLTHATVADATETYFPMHHDRVMATGLYQQLQSAPEYVVMSDEFKSSSDPTEQDVHYAVGKFKYMKEGPYVLSIWDEYDWDFPECPLGSIDEAAIAAMAHASMWGVLRDYNWEMVFY